MEAKTKPRIIVEAEIIRKDGTKVPLGVICDTKKGIGEIKAGGKKL